MSAANRESERQVIPRWRDLRATVRHREVGSSGASSYAPLPPARDLESLSVRAEEFREHGSLSYAADLLSASVVMGATHDTRMAAELS